jgi:hypothetical protein
MVQEYKMRKEKQAHESDEEQSDDSENSLTLYYWACASFKPEQGESNAESVERSPLIEQIIRDVDNFDPVITEAASPPSLHVKGEIPKEGELIVTKDSSTEGWFLSEVLRVLPNLVEVRYFTTPTPALENYEHCSVQKRPERLSEICFRRTWHVRFGKQVERAT